MPEMSNGPDNDAEDAFLTEMFGEINRPTAAPEVGDPVLSIVQSKGGVEVRTDGPQPDNKHLLVMEVGTDKTSRTFAFNSAEAAEAAFLEISNVPAPEAQIHSSQIKKPGS